MLTRQISQDSVVSQTVDQFTELRADEQLIILWRIYEMMGEAIHMAAPAVMFSQMVQSLFAQLLQLQRKEQIEALQDIASGEETRISVAYGNLSAPLKLAFWYRLAQAHKRGQFPAVPQAEHLSYKAERLLENLQQLGFNQKVTFLQAAVEELGQRW
ncbi:orange carotenoid protein N-terminal domain-containing protein [Almyronema epifaneia]|uniref:Orange carotenoid protein N-terminal domain-containing protein n=1 Tax=Almyronema epifaneia S1 TaxID=2991925 RepID=A0ABW6IBP5_9CYAN